MNLPPRDLAAELSPVVSDVSAEALDELSSRARNKPKLRGVSHLVGSVLAMGGAWVLAEAATTGRAHTAALMYGLSLVTMLTISGLYHTPYWPEGIREWWRRLDHAAVFVLTGGSYSVWCLLAMPLEDGALLFKVILISCGLGMIRALFWPRAPRWIIAGLYVVTGWIIIPWLGVMYRFAGPAAVWWAFAGGVSFTLSAVVYAKKWPNPWPRVFGYHEVMHLIVLFGIGIHFTYVLRLVSGAR